MHAIYTTKGWVLKNQIQGEANAQVVLYTEEFGLVRAHAQGLRKAVSKLAGHTALHTFGEYSLVRGKEVWRLVGAVSHGRIVGPEERRLFSRIAKLIERLIHGEEKSEPIFGILNQVQLFIERTGLGEEELFALELFLNVKILHLLGYLPKNTVTEHFSGLEEVSLEVLIEIKEAKDELLREVNRSLKASQM